MQEYIGEEITYVILQERPDDLDGVQLRIPLQYSPREGSFMAVSDFLSATAFKTQEEAVELANLQNQISTLLKQDLNYIVVESLVRRTQITGEPIVEPEVPESEEEPTE